MGNNNAASLEDFLGLFEKVLTPAQVLEAKLMAQVSSAITKERTRLGMTQSEFAKHIDVKQSQISRWERGDYNFSISKIADIAAKLNLDINIFATDASITIASMDTSYSSIKYCIKMDYSSKGHYDPEMLCSTRSMNKEELDYVTIL